jgi:hypothetical protein
MHCPCRLSCIDDKRAGASPPQACLRRAPLVENAPAVSTLIAVACSIEVWDRRNVAHILAADIDYHDGLSQLPRRLSLFCLPSADGSSLAALHYVMTISLAKLLHLKRQTDPGPKPNCSPLSSLLPVMLAERNNQCPRKRCE